jgi:hypothetical protein
MLTGSNRDVILFPQLRVNTGSMPKYGRNDLRNDYEGENGKLSIVKTLIDSQITADPTIDDSTINTIVDSISTNILDNKLIGTNAEKYHNNSKFLTDLKNTFKFIKYDNAVSNKKTAFKNYV